MLEQLRIKALEFVINFGKKSQISQEYPITDYKEIVDKIYKELTTGRKASFSDRRNSGSDSSSGIGRVIEPYMFRLAGQSGSGKSTQLLPAILHLCEIKGIDPIVIAVRLCASYHPFYKEIEAKYGIENIRENTNAFALHLLFLVMERLIQNKFLIIFEMTLLNPEFEAYFSELAKANNYKQDYHIIAVSKSQSDDWIEKRKAHSQTEAKREVAASSSSYFFDILPKALESLGLREREKGYLGREGREEREGRKNCFIWNIRDKQPVLISSIDDIAVLNTLLEYQNKGLEAQNPIEMLEYKKEWFSSYYKDTDFVCS